MQLFGSVHLYCTFSTTSSSAAWLLLLALGISLLHSGSDLRPKRNLSVGERPPLRSIWCTNMLFDEGRATPSCLSRSNRLRKYSSSMAGAAVETANSWPMTSRRRTAAASVVLRWWAVPVLLVVLFMFAADLDIFFLCLVGGCLVG